jgi:hypothetical protein
MEKGVVRVSEAIRFSAKGFIQRKKVTAKAVRRQKGSIGHETADFSACIKGRKREFSFSFNCRERDKQRPEAYCRLNFQIQD